MMLSSTTTSLLMAAAFATMTSGRPATSDLVKRAGGPAIVPIPATCTVTSPLPDISTTSYMPAPSTNDILLYGAYYPSFSSNTTAMAEQCLQQCYGYGAHVECKTAFWAENMVVPAGYYGTPGGQLSTACLMFTEALESSDLVAAPAGQASDAFAGTISC